MALYSFFSILEYTLDVIVDPYCIHSTISSHFMFQKTDVICLLEFLCLSSFGLFGECVCMQ
jgi:hypothetical protein